jgi:organic radical activating enzyme
MKLTDTLKVVEIFYSIQGEGANVGKPAIFVRLAGCNENCWFCDTDWTHGINMTMEEIKAAVQQYPAKMIIWTGGEPTLQLTDAVLEHFNGFFHCIETNGSNPVPAHIDYIACSPKVSPAILHKHFNFVDEFRYPLSVGQTPPSIDQLPPAANYFVSPIFEGEEKKRFSLNMENLHYCLDFVKQHPQWRLSVQVHKLLKVE